MGGKRLNKKEIRWGWRQRKEDRHVLDSEAKMTMFKSQLSLLLHKTSYHRKLGPILLNLLPKDKWPFLETTL